MIKLSLSLKVLSYRTQPTLTDALKIFIPLEAVLALVRILRNFGNLLSVIIVVVTAILVVVFALVIVIFFSKDLCYHVWLYSI